MPNHTLKFPMVGGDSKFVLICTHVHKFPHIHTQLISRDRKEIEITHTLAKWGSGSRKNKSNKKILIDRFFRQCRQSPLPIVDVNVGLESHFKPGSND